MFSQAFSGAQQRRLESCIFDCRKKRHAREKLEGTEQREVFQKKSIRSHQGRFKMKECEERTFGIRAGNGIEGISARSSHRKVLVVSYSEI
jgi:hypothetical protein